MKKTICLLLALVLCVSLCACGDSKTKEEDLWLPYGLEFGMSYDAFAKQLKKEGMTAPSIAPADANEGYFSDGLAMTLTDGEAWAFLGSPSLKTMAEEKVEYDTESNNGELFFADGIYDHCDPTLYFSFNQDKELYECYVMLEELNSDNIASLVIPEIIEHYNNRFFTNGKKSELYGAWESDEMAAYVEFTETEDVFEANTTMVVLHCFTYDLDS